MGKAPVGQGAAALRLVSSPISGYKAGWCSGAGPDSGSAMGHWLVWCLCLWAARPFLVSAVCPPEPGWRLPCGLATINSTECIKQGCCFQSPSLSGQSCFYNLRDSPVCTADSQFIVAITRNLTRPALNLSSLYVKDGHEAECRPELITAELVAFRFPITSCGSTQREENGSFVYEMDVLGKRMIQRGPLGSITRDSTFSLHVQCKYKGEHEAGLQINVSVYTLPPPLAASEDGILRLELRIATDGSYSWWYKDSDYPIQRILQESVFIEVHVKDRTDPMIVLRLRDCWATPVPAPDHEVQWSLLVDGCPYEGDDYLTLLHPVGVSSGLQFPTHHKRFEVKTFVFLDGVSEQPLSGQVYVHCSVEVCSPSAQDDCTTRCGPRTRRSALFHEGTLVSAPGPVVLLEVENSQSKQLLNENEPILEQNTILDSGERSVSCEDVIVAGISP
ncbi:zona pellucida sperm-binding protein 4-like [Hemiscyllium ocellatum]|uniref:zona pellucida sperm-binding protein 4-like n=1 Tax=Hemiscyllium ocellatum TaxID=170820 RepID=UPI0029666A25|nr:zona pellucida sperm-binding protein 4-like [Hemiscyllium ocellatum]